MNSIYVDRQPAAAAAAPSVKSDAEGRPGWVATAAATYGLIFGPSTVLMSGYGVLSGPIARSFGWTAGEVMLGVALISLAVVLSGPIQGALIDRFGGRKVVLWSTVLFALSLLGASQLNAGLFTFYASWGVMAFAALGLWPGSYLKVVSGWFRQRMGLAIGIANSGIPIGIMIVPPLTSWVSLQYGWRTAFVVLAGCVATTLIPLFFGFREREESSAKAPVDTIASTAPESILSLFKSREFKVLVVGFFLLGFSSSILPNLVPILIGTGLAPQTAAGYMSIFGLASLVARLLTGALLDRIFAGRLMNIFVLGVTAAFLLLAYAAALPGMSRVVAVVLIGFIVGAEFDVLAYALRKVARPALFGRGFGTIFSIFQLSGIFGTLFVSYSLRSLGGYTPVLMAFAVTAGLSLLAFGSLRDYRKLQASELA